MIPNLNLQRNRFFTYFTFKLFIEVLSPFICHFSIEIETDPTFKTFQMNVLTTAFTFTETNQLMIISPTIIICIFIIEIKTNSTLGFFWIELLTVSMIEILDF